MQTAARAVQRALAALAARLGIGPGDNSDQRAYWLALALLVTGALVTIGLAIGFSEMGEALGSPTLAAVDDWAARLAAAHRSPAGTRWARAVTAAGDTEAYLFLLVPAGLWLLWARRPWEAGFLIAVALGGSAIMWALKWSYMRPRPTGLHLAPTVGSSFPSGHSMVAACVYLSLAYLTWSWLARPSARWLAAAFYGVLILVIGLSRVYLGVHWLSDVAAGLAAGSAWAITCILGLEWLRWRARRKSHDGSSPASKPAASPPGRPRPRRNVA